MLLDNHLHHWLRERGSSLLVVQDTELPLADSFTGDVPALLLDNSNWLPGVEALIRSAELIVSECESLTPGVLAELRACAAAEKIDQTVLVLPSPPRRFVGNEPEVKPFARAMHQHELNPQCPARSAVFSDLIGRIAKIARMDPAKRTALVRQGKLASAIPISFRGVATGLFRIAQRDASEKNADGAYFSGSRAVQAAKASFGIARSLDLQLELADICGKAGNALLALTIVEDVEKILVDPKARLATQARERLRASVRRRRTQWLAAEFESLMSKQENSALWQLANSQAGYALERGDSGGVAQCLSWMSVAAIAGEKYELGKEHAQDAIAFAKKSGDKFREGFAQYYLGSAYRALGELREAAEAGYQAIKLLRAGKPGRIQAAAMLGMADVTERLGQRESALQLYLSARDLAQGLAQTDLWEVSEEGVARLSQASKNDN